MEHIFESFRPKIYMIFMLFLELIIGISENIFVRIPCNCSLIGSTYQSKRYSSILHIHYDYVPCPCCNSQVFISMIKR